MADQHNHQVIIVGSGLAGLATALLLHDRLDVAVITKDVLGESNSNWAQGGIAAVVDSDDSLEAHVRDTLEAGDGLCNPDVVRRIVEHAPHAVELLEQWGVRFARDEHGRYELGREGGHSQRRILHAGDITGYEIQQALVRMVRARGVRVYDRTCALELITSGRAGRGAPGRVLGLYAIGRGGEVEVYGADTVVLATGGAGKVYLYTTNPDAATGDGVAMAARAGLSCVNMEFYQFHPTCLYHPQAKNFLLSEAIRGEGARIVSREGVSIMDGVHPLGDLAPRDVVARAIDKYLKDSGDDCVYLDCRARSESFLRERFPNLYARCLSFGFDMGREPVPVVPAAHYQCGGIAAELDGSTALSGLRAIGECAYTGLHGANRLASNSLLEALVQASACAQSLLQKPRADLSDTQLPAWQYTMRTSPAENVLISHTWDEVRRLMNNYVGIVRSVDRLDRALRRLRLIQDEVHALYWQRRPERHLVELRNLVLVAELIVRSARFRRESRGLHTMLEYPTTGAQWLGTTIIDPQRMDVRLGAL